MNLNRNWILVPVISLLVFFMGFGCATKSEKPPAILPPTLTSATNFVIAKPLPVQPPATPPPVTSTQPVYVPDISHVADPLPDGILAWDDLTKAIDVASTQPEARFTFLLTNVSSGNVTIVNVHPSCGCTTAQLPPMPWTLAPGADGQINLTVNLASKTGTLFKTVNIATDKGSKTLTLQIRIQPPAVQTLSDAERMRGMEIAKADRQAVFKNDCATCHLKPGEARYGKELYDTVCGICHEAEHRASMVPDLHTLKVPTNDQFWRIWIAHGKPGSLMPAFSTTDGGPLSDLQIASLAAYLNAAMPSHVAPTGE